MDDQLGGSAGERERRCSIETLSATVLGCCSTVSQRDENEKQRKQKNKKPEETQI
jgi:hypothetical protein